jgi:hypothetical protein
MSSRTYSLLLPKPRVATCSSTKDLSDFGRAMFFVLIDGTIGVLAKFAEVSLRDILSRALCNPSVSEGRSMCRGKFVLRIEFR